MKVLVADGHYLSNQGILKILDKHEEITSVYSLTDKESLFKELDTAPVDLVVADPRSFSDFTFKDIEVIRKKYEAIKLLIIASKYDYVFSTDLINSGITAFVTKQCSEEEINKAISFALRGERFFCNTVLEVVLNGNKELKTTKDCSPSSLSERETQIMLLVGEGLTTNQIADKLCLSVHTVNTHRKNIGKKLKIKNPVQLIKAAIELDQ